MRGPTPANRRPLENPVPDEEHPVKRHSRLTAAAIAAALIAPVSGCAAMFTPQATEIHYAGGDGASTTIGDVEVDGLIVVTKGKNKPGQLIASVFNSSKSAKTVKIATPNFSKSVTVKPGGEVHLNPKDGKNVVIPKVSTKPGELLKMSVQSGSVTKKFNSQVFNGTLPQYRKYLPSSKSQQSKPSRSSNSSKTKSGSQG